MSVMGDDWFAGVVSVCMYGGFGAAFDELCVNKFCGLGGERF